MRTTKQTWTPSKRAAQWIGAGVASIGLLGGGAMAWSALRPINAPDALRDPMRDVLGFALLSDDFNKLPIEERLRLVMDLAQRLQGLSAGDSALLAAFAAGIRGEARDRLERNVRTLGVDMMTSYANRYSKVPEADRAQFMDEMVVEWSKMMEQLTGQTRDVDDAQRLQEMKDQANRDAERARQNNRPLTADRAANFFTMMQEDIATYADANQRAQTARFFRDMTRHLRGRDIETNQPKKR
ncbi:MAG: hypothetical protein IBJ10_05820 [Phycisphaerales bacterium]|nr:hypothetical protein [Phycisphaerales bacterium]